MRVQPVAVQARLLPQVTAEGGTHAPAPLQAEAGWNWDDRAPHEAGLPQEVPFATCWQPLAPLQVPVFPQAAPVAH